MDKIIYMDNHATTPVDPRVLEAMLPYFRERFGNAASRNHAFGWEAEEACNQARERIARLIHAQPKEIIFTSGATESNNLAIKGVAESYRDKGMHMLTSPTEHRAVLDPCRVLEKKGFSVTYLPVDRTGIVDPDDVRKALTDRTILISLMFANNEIGTLHPMHEIGKIAREKGVLFHCDATQAAGKVPIDVDAMGIDLLSISAHKMYGPKGVGALYVRSRKPRVLLIPLLHGGGHEKGMRSGTLNVPGIIGFARACGLCEDEMASEQERLLRLREKLRKGITNRLDEVFLNGHPERRLAGNLNLSFSYVEAESLLMALPDVALSSASACSSASLEPSHVLRAIGVREDLAQASIRFGLGRFNTEQEVDYVMERVVGEVTRLRKLSPFYEIARARILSGQLPASKKGRESFVEEI